VPVSGVLGTRARDGEAATAEDPRLAGLVPVPDVGGTRVRDVIDGRRTGAPATGDIGFTGLVPVPGVR
jgi:hypothetical protein